MSTQQERRGKIPTGWRTWAIVGAVASVLLTAGLYYFGDFAENEYWKGLSRDIFIAVGGIYLIIAARFTYLKSK
jgi:hypothetical protein